MIFISLLFESTKIRCGGSLKVVLEKIALLMNLRSSLIDICVALLMQSNKKSLFCFSIFCILEGRFESKSVLLRSKLQIPITSYSFVFLTGLDTKNSSPIRE